MSQWSSVFLSFLGFIPLFFSTSITCICPGLSVYDNWRPPRSLWALYIFPLLFFSCRHPSPAFLVASFCSCTGGLSEVCDYHFGFPKLLHTSTHRPDYTLQSPIKSLQVEFSQNGPKWIPSQRLSHHITETILWFHQQLQPQQCRALDPEGESVPQE